MYAAQTAWLCSTVKRAQSVLGADWLAVQKLWCSQQL